MHVEGKKYLWKGFLLLISLFPHEAVQAPSSVLLMSSYFSSLLLICVPLSGCVCSLWLCFQCWELCNFVLHRFLCMFPQQHPSTLKSVALQQYTQPENPSGREKPADCLPKRKREDGLDLILGALVSHLVFKSAFWPFFLCLCNCLACEPHSGRITWTCTYIRACVNLTGGTPAWISSSIRLWISSSWSFSSTRSLSWPRGSCRHMYTCTQRQTSNKLLSLRVSENLLHISGRTHQQNFT